MAKKKKSQNPLVVQSNFFIRRKKKNDSLNMLRLVAALAKRVHKDDEDFKEYEIPAAEILGENFGGRALNELKDSARALLTCIYERQYDNGDWEMSSVIEHPQYNAGRATLTVKFAPAMKTHYLNLKSEFTQYSYEEFMQLPSTYTQRIYEILKSYQPMGVKDIDIDDLHEWLDTPEAYRKDFAKFRTKVLDQAYKDIVQSGNITSLWFTWEPIKKGRGGRVAEIRFIFNPVTAEREADTAEEIARQKKKADRAEIQSRSWGCYNEHQQKHIDCVPKLRNEKCKYCLEKGGMFTRAVAAGRITEDEMHSPIVGQIVFDFLRTVD